MTKSTAVTTAKKTEKISNTDDLLHILSRKDKNVRSAFFWKKVDQEVHRRLLYLIARELNLSNPRLIASKFLEKQRFRFLNNLPLNGLYSYYKNKIPRKKGIHIITRVCDLLNIPPVSIEDWLDYIKRHNIFSWGNIPRAVKKEILLRACRERGYRHPIQMSFDDFALPFQFLNNKALTGFYNHFNSLHRGIRGMVIKNMCNMLKIKITEEDWITYITTDNTMTLWNIIPKPVLKNLLFRAAGALGYSNPRMMSTDDLKTGIDFLQGLSFYSFASRYFGVDTKGVRTIDYICDEYEVPPLTFEEWLCLAGRQANFRWERFPRHYLGRLLALKADEAKKESPRMLRHEDFCRPFSTLNNRNLTGLYNCYARLKKDKKIDTVDFLCDLAGIPALDFSQWLAGIKHGSKISWESLPPELVKEIIWKAAEELGLKNPRLMDQSSFYQRFSFLNGKTLSGLYAHFSARAAKEQSKVLPFICDTLGIERLTLKDWFNLIGTASLIRWEKVPPKVQREVVLKAAAEMNLPHPRLMKTREFTSVPLQFLYGKTLAGLYCHYAEKKPQPGLEIPEYIMNTLQIPQAEINLQTGRVSTIDSLTHRKYFDSRANCKAFLNTYLKQFSLESLCKKYSMLRNAKKAGIYKKGLVTLVAPMNKKTYVDFLYELLKNTPRDSLGLRKRRNGDYRLLKNDLYALAGIKEKEDKQKKISPARIARVQEKPKEDVLRELRCYQEILSLKEKKYHQVSCTCLSADNETAVFNVPAPFLPGDILSAGSGEEFKVIECRTHIDGEGYLVELEALSPVPVDWVSQINTLVKDSNEAVLGAWIERLQERVENNTLSPLLAVTLGRKKEKQLYPENLKILPEKAYFNKKLTGNEAQKQAVNLALTLDGNVYTLAVIQGPPGAGKTTLITEIGLQYYSRGKNVLILAKTNVAVDNIMERLMKEKIRVLRSGNNLHWKSNLPGVHKVSTANPFYLATLENTNKIVLGTPLGFYLDRNLAPEEYDLVIIDEASQMDFPETLFSLDFAKKCVMIGDHLQIPPYPIAQEILTEYNPRLTQAEREKLQQSLFEKLITDRDRFNSVFLDINYRTEHPEMVSFISDLVYDGRLSCNLESDYYRLSPAGRKKFFPYPIEIVDTADIPERNLRVESEINSTYYNLTEAMLCVRKVLNLLEDGESLHDICIITPYKAQVEKIKEIFLKNYKYFSVDESNFTEFTEKNIYTVDSFQGREEENVIISWVRSNYEEPKKARKTGFLKDFRRVNVSLSRARKKMILIGDFDTLTNSENSVVQYIFGQIKNLQKEEKIVL